MRARALYICEGTSDLPLADLLADAAYAESFDLTVTSPDLSRLGARVGSSVRAKVHAALGLYGSQPDVLFIHRDADTTGSDTRRREIAAAIDDYDGLTVAVVPVRMTEAWLLVREDHIRQVAGNPRGRADLGLPSGASVESVTDPKATLRDAIMTASGATGRRRDALRKRFPLLRRQLAELLDPDDLRDVPSWEATRAQLRAALTTLRAGQHGAS